MVLVPKLDPESCPNLASSTLNLELNKQGLDLSVTHSGYLDDALQKNFREPAVRFTANRQTTLCQAVCAACGKARPCSEIETDQRTKTMNLLDHIFAGRFTPRSLPARRPATRRRTLAAIESSKIANCSPR